MNVLLLEKVLCWWCIDYVQTTSVELLCPLLDIYSDMTHSYIVELKYAKSKDTDAHIQQLFKEAEAQVNRYAQSEVVTSAVKTTQLHKIVVIYRGTEMVVCEEVTNQ